MWPIFANDASSNGLLSLTSLSHTLPISIERLSIIAHYPSVAIRAAWSGLQSVLVHRMRWAYHHLFQSYELRPYKRTICSRDTLFAAKITKRKRNPKYYIDFLDYVPKIICKRREYGRGKVIGVRQVTSLHWQLNRQSSLPVGSRLFPAPVRATMASSAVMIVFLFIKPPKRKKIVLYEIISREDSQEITCDMRNHAIANISGSQIHQAKNDRHNQCV